MIKSAHVEPLLCPFNGLPFCTLVPMGILNASSLYCQPDHVPTLIYTFQWPSITLRLKPKVLSIGLPRSGSLLPLRPQFHPLCASLFQSGLFLFLEHAEYTRVSGLLLFPLLETLFPRYAHLSLYSHLCSNAASSERPSLIKVSKLFVE